MIIPVIIAAFLEISKFKINFIPAERVEGKLFFWYRKPIENKIIDDAIMGNAQGLVSKESNSFGHS